MTRRDALVPHKSAMQQACHAGDRICCARHADDLVVVQTG